MNEQQLNNTIALIRAGARAMIQQEPDNGKAASVLVVGEESVKALIEMCKPKETIPEFKAVVSEDVTEE